MRWFRRLSRRSSNPCRVTVRCASLELGAGTGGTTAHVLPHLDAARTEYYVTDVGAYFLGHAKEAFGRHPFVRYAVLDVEKSLDAQGWQGGRFDLVIAANVLHATSDLEQTLRNVRRLLTPGGMLVLLEGSERRLWLDITFGLTDGWWRFSDASLRPNYPLIPPDHWRTPLRAAGFSSVTSVTPPGGMIMAQSIIMARADADASSSGGHTAQLAGPCRSSRCGRTVGREPARAWAPLRRAHSRGRGRAGR